MGVALKVTALGRGLYRVAGNGGTWKVAVAGPPDNRWVWVGGQATKVEAHEKGRARVRSTSHDLAAPMPATVVRVLVEPGATVARGDTVLMLEAMKMELPIRAPRDGVVRAVHCKQGELVQPGLNLLDID